MYSVFHGIEHKQQGRHLIQSHIFTSDHEPLNLLLRTVWMDINLPRQRERTCVWARLTRAAGGTGRNPPDSVSDPVVYKLASHNPAGASLSSHASAWDSTRAVQYKPHPASARIHSHQCSHAELTHSSQKTQSTVYARMSCKCCMNTSKAGLHTQSDNQMH